MPYILDYYDFINESLRYSKGINQKTVIKIQKEIKESLLSLFRISENDMSFIGSAGKRDKNDLSKNINLAIDVNKLLKTNNINLSELNSFVKNEFKRLGISTQEDGNKLIASWKNKKESIDLVIQFTENLDWVKFSRYSPSIMLKESKYPGKYREAVFAGLSRVLEKKIVSYFDTNESVREYETYRFNPDDGLCIYRKSFEGKNGKLKQPILLESSKRIFCDEPNEFVKMLFGDKYNIDDVKTFESCIEIINSKDFKFSKRKNEVLKKIKQEIVGLQLTVPENLM